MNEIRLVPAQQLKNIAFKALTVSGLPEEAASLAADVLTLADIRGMHTHGVNKLHHYLKRFGNGLSNKDATLKIINETPCTYSLDAQNGLGIAMAPQAMKMTVEKAKKNGICACVVRNSGHFGMGASYGLQAAKEGLIGFVMSDSVQLMAPFGGRERVLGNSPWCVVFPATREGADPVMLDMSCSEAALGKMEIAKILGKKIPMNWAMGTDGKPTDDPEEGLKAATLCAFGGAKGYCTAFMWELMTTALSAGCNAKDISVVDIEKEHISHFFMAIDPKVFNPIEDINAVANEICDSVKNSQPAEGVKEIFLPGEIEARRARKSVDEGVEMDVSLLNSILNTLKKHDILPENATIEEMLNM